MKNFLIIFLLVIIFLNKSYFQVKAIKDVNTMTIPEISGELDLEIEKFKSNGSMFQVYKLDAIDLKLAYINIARLNELLNKYSSVKKYLQENFDRFVFEVIENTTEFCIYSHINIAKRFAFINLTRFYYENYLTRLNGDITGMKTGNITTVEPKRVLEYHVTARFAHILFCSIAFKMDRNINYKKFYSDLKKEICESALKYTNSYNTWICGFAEKEEMKWLEALFVSLECNNSLNPLTHALNDWLIENL